MVVCFVLVSFCMAPLGKVLQYWLIVPKKPNVIFFVLLTSLLRKPIPWELFSPEFLIDLAPSNSPGKKHGNKELRVKFAKLCQTTISEWNFVSNILCQTIFYLYLYNNEEHQQQARNFAPILQDPWRSKEENAEQSRTLGKRWTLKDLLEKKVTLLSRKLFW